MPEGPEIRREADKVEVAIINKPVLNVFFAHVHLKHWESKLIGATVKCVDTYGKAMLTRFDNGLNIYSHNQLYGRWFITPYGSLPDTSRQLRLAIHTKDKSALLYSASEIEVLENKEVVTHPFLQKLGPDVLSNNTTKKIILERLKAKQFNNRQLGIFLTDQRFVAGLGNYLRCEILFIVGLSPKTKPSQLNDHQLEQLARAILNLSRQSYKTAGITYDLEKANQLIKQGHNFEDARFWVFRREGLKCYRCQSEIKAQISGGQKCYFCTSCQHI